jgi:hypothetical protein
MMPGNTTPASLDPHPLWYKQAVFFQLMERAA